MRCPKTENLVAQKCPDFNQNILVILKTRKNSNRSFLNNGNQGMPSPTPQNCQNYLRC